MKKTLFLFASHAVAIAIGFGAGIYMLPILTEPPGPSNQQIETAALNAQYTGEFRRDLKDSDALHWGEGKVFVGPKMISLQGKVAPGPDYRLYLSPEFIETEADFLKLKPKMIQVGDVKTFDNFVVPVASNINPSAYNTVIVWCEAFGQFISAAKYQ